MKENYLLAGQFAKICHVTKKALYVYEQKGLLTPALVKSNGYRYYRLEQADVVATITLLQKLGSSLNEIESFFHLTDLSAKKAYLDAKRKAVFKQREMLKQMDESLAFVTKRLQDFAAVGENKVCQEVLNQPKYYQVTALKHNISLNPTRFGLEYGILTTDFLDEKPDKFFKAVSPKKANFIKPAGRYVYFYVRLKNAEIPRYAKKALKKLQAFEPIIPPLYQEDFSSAVLGQDDYFIVKYAAEVKQNK